MFLLLLKGSGLYAQYFYVAGPSSGGSFVLGLYNIATCQYCSQFSVPFSVFPTGLVDVVPLPNGNVVGFGNQGQISIFSPPSATAISSASIPGGAFVTGAVLAPNGNIYVTAYTLVGGCELQLSVIWMMLYFHLITNTKRIRQTRRLNKHRSGRHISRYTNRKCAAQTGK